MIEIESLATMNGGRLGWSGNIILPDGPVPPIAEPQLLARNHNSTTVMAAGALTDAATINLGLHVLSEARQPENSVVFVVLMVSCGRLGVLQTVRQLFDQARKHAAIVAYAQECLWGPGLLLANFCDLVYAHPSTQIGVFGCQTEDGDYAHAETCRMIAELAATNPAVPATTYAKFVRSHTTAEQAEALGMVDGLRRDLDNLTN
jgi:hypothetical protein